MQKKLKDLERQKKGRLVLLGLTLFFMAPLVLVLYMYQTNWHPTGESKGQLIKPVVAIKVPDRFQKIKTFDKTDLSNTLWHEKWSMVVIADQCDPICEARLYDVRQIHASLEKNMNRVQRILITHQQVTEALHIKYPDLIIINDPKEEVDELANQFQLSDQSPFNGHGVYLVDPLGNWMMQYDADMAAKDIRKDVEHLLRYSWAG